MTPEEISRLPYRPCVGVMLANREGQVWVGQRIDWPEPAWQMPQGGVDDGEDPQVAAVRELEEETGIPPDRVRIEAETAGWIPYDLPLEIVPKRWGGRYRGQEQKWFLLRYLGTDDQIDIATAHPEFSEWRWIEPKDLPGQIVQFKRAVYEAVLQEFGDKI